MGTWTTHSLTHPQASSTRAKVMNIVYWGASLFQTMGEVEEEQWFKNGEAHNTVLLTKWIMDLSLLPMWTKDSLVII